MKVKLGIFKLPSIIFLVCLIVLVTPTIYTYLATKSTRYDLTKVSISEIPQRKVALIFGAGIQLDGEPTPYLRQRLDTAVTLYKAKRVDKLLLTADNSSVYYNEPIVMKRYVEKSGVLSKDITLDLAGFNTYDSCYRAKAVFSLRDATLVSQAYHLPRAMKTCQAVGVNNIGVIATSQSRDYTFNYLLREVLATDKMIIQIVLKPKPTALGEPVLIK